MAGISSILSSDGITIERLSGAGVFVVPSTVDLLWVTICGAGGGGSGGGFHSTSAYGGGGGGAGACLNDFPLVVSPGDEIAYSCGAGGLGGTARSTGSEYSYGRLGTAGGNTTFGNLLLYGGITPATATSSDDPGANGSTVGGAQSVEPTGNNATSNPIFVSAFGVDVESPPRYNASYTGGGYGGSTPLGAGGDGSSVLYGAGGTLTDGGNARGYGGGGGGGGGVYSTNYGEGAAGGNGGDGIILLRY